MHGLGDKLEEKREPRGRELRKSISAVFFSVLQKGSRWGSTSQSRAMVQSRAAAPSGSRGTRSCPWWGAETGSSLPSPLCMPVL